MHAHKTVYTWYEVLRIDRIKISALMHTTGTLCERPKIALLLGGCCLTRAYRCFWRAYHPLTAFVVLCTLFLRQNEPRRHTFADLRALALAIRGALSPLLLRGGPCAAEARNVGVLAQGGAFALYAAWLAVLWEGCAVVPLSTEAPVERIRSIVEDALVTVVLATDQGSAETAKAIFQASNLCFGDVRVVDVRTLGAAGNDHEEDRSVAVSNTVEKEEVGNSDAAGGDRACYVYYTSGSSGEPKGVSSWHGPMINRLRWMWQRWPFLEDEVCCQRVDHVFIDFVAEMFGPLSCGISIIVVPYVVRKNPVLLRDFISKYSVTRITLVPTLAMLIVEAATTARLALYATGGSHQTPRVRPSADVAFFKSVRLWILSGEALPWSVANSLAQLSQPTSTLLNLYGSTEVAADITFSSWKCNNMAKILSGDDGRDQREGNAKVNRGNTPSAPIGRPISGCGAELMEEVLEQGSESGTCDNRLPSVLRVINPRDHGRVGILYVCGAGLARGYWRRENATEKCFPSYAWDSESSCFRLCSRNAPVPKNVAAPRTPGDHNVHNGVVGGTGQNGCRDGRPIRFFRTGDLASFEKDHHGGGDSQSTEEWLLVYRGREDQQVKISGKRLDLGEVEACLFRADGVTLGAAVALSGPGVVDTEGSGDEEGPGLIFAVLSPVTVDTAIVRENLARRFAVPLVVVAVPIVPTLPSSGKVDRGEVRRMALEHLRRQRSNMECDVSVKKTGAHGGDKDTWNRSVEEVVDLIKTALLCALQPGRDLLARQSEISDNSDFFTEVGISSVQAVHFVHELRHVLSASGDDSRCDGPRTARLIDLYLHPSCRSLAQWLVPVVDRTGDTSIKDGDFARETALRIASVTVSGEESSIARESLEDRGSGDVKYNVVPIRRDLRSEMLALFCNLFLDSEPLLSSSFNRCRSSVGPAGGAVMRLCYNRLVSRSIDFLLRNGGRVLVATENATGRVLGFTIGTELVESAKGSGFLASCVEGRGNVEESSGPARRGTMNAYRRTKPTPWQKGTNWLFDLPIRPMMRPVSALINELLNIYQYDRGWAYAPGEVMYISETGCHLDLPKNGKMEGVKARRGAKTTGTSGSGGVQAALMAESLERQLVLEASAAGFVRAVTICTNAVTVHVARELGFKEVARIPVQTYCPLSGQKKAGRWRGCPHPRIHRQNRAPPSAEEHSSSLDPRSAPFARVPVEHANVVLFEKILAPSVPLELLLHRSRQGTERRTTPSAALSDCGITSAAGELWQLVRVEEGSPGHQHEMLAILANSLPVLASSGRATRYMADDVDQGREAVLLLSTGAPVIGTGTSGETSVVAPAVATAEESTGQPDEPDEAHANPSESLSSRWTVAACMSWCRHTSVSDDSLGEGRLLDTEAGGRDAGEGRAKDESMAELPSAWRELLVLAVGRRWRYRGLGAALVARLLRDSAQDGESHVHVRSLPESVGFYERQGFRTIEEGVRGTGGEHGVAAPVPNRDGECLLVHDLVHGTSCLG